MLASLSTPGVYRLRPAQSTDSVGDPVLEYTNPDRTPIRGAQFQMRSTTTADGVIITSRDLADLLIIGTADLTATDRVEANGVTWRIDGDPIVGLGLASGAVTEAALVRLATR